MGTDAEPDDVFQAVMEAQRQREDVLAAESTDNSREGKIPDVHYVYISADKSEEMTTMQEDAGIVKPLRQQVNEEVAEAVGEVLVEHENILDPGMENVYSGVGEEVKTVDERKEEQQRLGKLPKAAEEVKE